MWLVVAVSASPAATRRPVLALSAIVLSTYAVIAVARAPLAVILGASFEGAAAQARYHYLGPLGIVIVLCVLLADLGRRSPLRSPRLDGVLAVWTAIALALRLVRGLPVDHHDKARYETQAVLEQIHLAARHASDGTSVYVTNRRFNSRGWVAGNDPAEFPGWAAVLMISQPEDVVDGRPIYFVEPRPRVLAMARAAAHKRIGRLIIAPGQVPTAPAAANRPPSSGGSGPWFSPPLVRSGLSWHGASSPFKPPFLPLDSSAGCQFY